MIDWFNRSIMNLVNRLIIRRFYLYMLGYRYMFRSNTIKLNNKRYCLSLITRKNLWLIVQSVHWVIYLMLYHYCITLAYSILTLILLRFINYLNHLFIKMLFNFTKCPLMFNIFLLLNIFNLLLLLSFHLINLPHPLK